MKSFGDNVKWVLFTLILFVWSAEFIKFPGQGAGQSKKDWIVKEADAEFDKLLPDNTVGKWAQGMLTKVVSAVIDWVVGMANKEGSFDKIKEMLASFFPATFGTATSNHA